MSRTSQGGQHDGHDVSSPSHSDISQTQDNGLLAQSRGDSAELQNPDTPHADTSNLVDPASLIITSTYFDDLKREETQKAQLDVVDQILTDTIEDELDVRLDKYATKIGMSYDRIVEKSQTDPEFLGVVAVECAHIEPALAERASYKHMQNLEAYEKSSVLKVDRLPISGNDAMHLTNHGLLFGNELTKKGPKRDKNLCKTMDTSALVMNTTQGPVLTIQYNKHTTGQGGSQDYAFNDVKDFVKGVNRMKLTQARAPRNIDPTGTQYPVVFVAVLDGTFWDKAAIKKLSRECKVAKSIAPGGLYICDTAGLQEFYESVAKAQF